jgi:hypothetical protein
MVMIGGREMTVREVAPEVWQYRYDPASPWPDFTCLTLGAVCHLQETGHAIGPRCCKLATANGLHILPQHRVPGYGA